MEEKKIKSISKECENFEDIKLVFKNQSDELPAISLYNVSWTIL